MTNEQELRWLAGFIEAEGCFHTTYTEQTRITIPNTQKDLIDYCQQILSKIGVNSYVRKEELTEPRTDRYDLTISSWHNCYKLYTHLFPYIHCRRNEFSSTIDENYVNPTITYKDRDIVWVAGLIEGEATFCVTASSYIRRGSNLRNIVYHPVVAIQNTNSQIIDKLIITLDCYNLRATRALCKRKMKANWSPAQEVGIRKKTDIVLFLDLVRPYLVSHKYKSRGKLLKEFCDLGLSSYRYTPRQIEIYQELKAK